jgi:uncharacterized protein (TIRG00374 family)
MLLKVALSLAVGAVCVAYAVHGMNGRAVLDALRVLSLSAIAIYCATLALTHLFRAWRWTYLLRPLGVRVPLPRLLLISSAGFMAIMALPVRLGEFVRPYFLARERDVRMSAALGTVAVERIVDGLLISILFFVSYLASSEHVFSRELCVGAWLSLVGFLALTTFLALAQVWTEQTIALTLRLTLLQWIAPTRAHHFADKLRSLISGFRVLADGRNFAIFVSQSLLYWGMNGAGMWILARQMGLGISLWTAYTTMAFTGVVLMVPNSPGLVGQFEAGVKLSLLAYLPASVVNSTGMAYAIVLHGLQTVWYVGIGLLCLPALSTGGGRNASLGAAVRESNRAAAQASGPETGGI